MPGNTTRLLPQSPFPLSRRKFDFTCKLCCYWGFRLQNAGRFSSGVESEEARVRQKLRDANVN